MIVLWGSILGPPLQTPAHLTGRIMGYGKEELPTFRIGTHAFWHSEYTRYIVTHLAAQPSGSGDNGTQAAILLAESMEQPPPEATSACSASAASNNFWRTRTLQKIKDLRAQAEEAVASKAITVIRMDIQECVGTL